MNPSAIKEDSHANQKYISYQVHARRNCSGISGRQPRCEDRICKGADLQARAGDLDFSSHYDRLDDRISSSFSHYFKVKAMVHSEDERYYFQCPLRKNHARIPVTVCHKQKCLWLTNETGPSIGSGFQCGYGDPNASVSNRPRVKKISRDGVI